MLFSLLLLPEVDVPSDSLLSVVVPPVILMGDLMIGVIGIVMLYGLGQLLYPDEPHINFKHKPIQQELIKMGDEKHEK